MKQELFLETDLENNIMETVRGAERRYTPLDLERFFASRYRITRRTVRRVVKALIAENRLAYTHLLGHSFLEISYKRPVHVGGGVILAPPDVSLDSAEPGQIEIRIAPGAAFGMGDHATTRLALQLMTWSINEQRLLGDPSGLRALDIGTGSGVLAIGACRMGIGEAVGIDTDACARVEATENIRLNHLEGRVHIIDEDLDSLSGKFSLILANLRYPTLTDLHDLIMGLCAPQTVLIFSGFREHELPGLLDAYAGNGVEHLRTRIENAWVGIVMKKADLKS